LLLLLIREVKQPEEEKKATQKQKSFLFFFGNIFSHHGPSLQKLHRSILYGNHNSHTHTHNLARSVVRFNKKKIKKPKNINLKKKNVCGFNSLSSKESVKKCK